MNAHQKDKFRHIHKLHVTTKTVKNEFTQSLYVSMDNYLTDE